VDENVDEAGHPRIAVARQGWRERGLHGRYSRLSGTGGNQDKRGEKWQDSPERHEAIHGDILASALFTGQEVLGIVCFR
jgi:hypothetical protein